LTAGFKNSIEYLEHISIGIHFRKKSTSSLEIDSKQKITVQVNANSSTEIKEKNIAESEQYKTKNSNN